MTRVGNLLFGVLVLARFWEQTPHLLPTVESSLLFAEVKCGAFQIRLFAKHLELRVQLLYLAQSDDFGWKTLKNLGWQQRDPLENPFYGRAVIFRALSSFLSQLPYIFHRCPEIVIISIPGQKHGWINIYINKKNKTSSSPLEKRVIKMHFHQGLAVRALMYFITFHLFESRKLFQHDKGWKEGSVLLLNENSQEWPALGPCGKRSRAGLVERCKVPYLLRLLQVWPPCISLFGKRLLQDLKPSNYVRFTPWLWS